MGGNHSSSNYRKSYYSVEYLNSDLNSLGNESNKINSSSSSYINEHKNDSSMYETIDYSEQNRYQSLSENICNKTYVIQKRDKHYSSNSSLSKIFDIDRKTNLPSVKRSKSYVKPENKVLPREYLSKPLRETNLLKTDGLKRTWRNKNNLKLKKTNSTTILDQVEKRLIKPSLIKSLINQSHPNITLPVKIETQKKILSDEATSADECTDLDYEIEYEIDQKSIENFRLKKMSHSMDDVKRDFDFQIAYENSSKNNLNNKSESFKINKNNYKNRLSSISHYMTTQNKELSIIKTKERDNEKIDKTSKNINNNNNNNNKTKLKSKSFLNQIKSYKSTKKFDKIHKTTKLDEYEEKENFNHSKSKLISNLTKSPSKLVNRFKSFNKTTRNSIKRNSYNKINRTNTDIQIISRFPINSKVYRHYISGNSFNSNLTNNIENKNFDKLTNCIEASNIINNFNMNKEKFLNLKKNVLNYNNYQESDLERTYDSIKDYKSKKKDSPISPSSEISSSNRSTSPFSVSSQSTRDELYFNKKNDLSKDQNVFKNKNNMNFYCKKNSSTSNVNNEFNFNSSPASSSIFSALTSSSLIHSSNSSTNALKDNKLDVINQKLKLQNKYEKPFTSSINISSKLSNNNKSYLFEQNYNNNFNNIKNMSQSEMSLKIDNKSESINFLKNEPESHYEILSNANSGTDSSLRIFQSNSQASITSKKKNFNFEESKRLNEILQDEIQKAYEERSKRFEQAKKALQSNPNCLVDLNSLKNQKINSTQLNLDSSSERNNKIVNDTNNIQSKINAFENSIKNLSTGPNILKQSKSSAFTKIESNIKTTSQNFKIQLVDKIEREIPSFYLRPPVNYDDDHDYFYKKKSNDKLEYSFENDNDSLENDNNIKFSENLREDKIKFVEILDCKSNKFKFIPEKEYFPPNFEAPPPPPEFSSNNDPIKNQINNLNENNYEEFGINSFSSVENEKSTVSSTSSKKYNNFILRPKSDLIVNKNKTIDKFLLKPSKLIEDSTKNQPLNKKDAGSAIILIDSEKNQKKSEVKNNLNNKTPKSVSKGRRKGLEEIFPGIKITRKSLNNDNRSSDGDNRSLDSDYKNSEHTLKLKNSFSRIDDPEWCPASDLYDFDLDDSDYDSNYQLSSFRDTKKDNLNIYGSNNFLEMHTKAEKFIGKNFIKLPLITSKSLDQKPKADEKIDYSEILNSIENFYY